VPRAWLCIPSARDKGGTSESWMAKGYGVALFRDAGSSPPVADLVLRGEYQGYAKSVNQLALAALRFDPECQWVVAAGDDTFPEQSIGPDEIATQLEGYFGGTFGICQFTGHRWGENEPWARQRFPDAPAYIDRVCGSPWLGREWCLRGNQGAGPLHPGFFHMHVDECLQEVAKKLGILWQRRDLTHFHNHWGLGGFAENQPEFLRKVNSPEHWRESKELLDRLRGDGFAECMPL
jgi:hypothetical protein